MVKRLAVVAPVHRTKLQLMQTRGSFHVGSEHDRDPKLRNAEARPPHSYHRQVGYFITDHRGHAAKAIDCSMLW